MVEASSIEKLEKELKQLIMETRAGDKGSYNRLLTALLPFLRRNAGAQMHRFGYGQFAEDAVQETLLAIHLKLHTYDDGQPFLAWLRAVMKHKIIDCLRKQNEDMVSIDANDFIEPAAAETAETYVVQNDLKLLLDQLKPPSGDIIYEMKVEGMSVKELAGKYGMSEGNVKVMVHRGLQRLSALVGEAYNGD